MRLAQEGMIVVITMATFFMALTASTLGAIVHQPQPSLTPSPIATWQVYLPAIMQAPALATITVTPTHTPSANYVLVESWKHSFYADACGDILLDHRVYEFQPQDGSLFIYAFLTRKDLTLNHHDIGYVGKGVSLGGAGSSVNSDLTKFRAYPVKLNKHTTLKKIDGTGMITLDYQGDVTHLEAGSRWVISQTVKQPNPANNDCIVTTTHYIDNHAFQRRAKIEIFK